MIRRHISVASISILCVISTVSLSTSYAVEPVPAQPRSLVTATATATSATTDVADRADSVLSGVTGDQVIIVTTQHRRDTHGTLRALQREADGTWSVVVPTVHAWVGRGGITPGQQRRQSTGTTPSGAFSLLWAFGTATDPGTQMRYVQVDDSDIWPYDPRDPQTYNVFQPRATAVNRTWRSGWAEPLSSYTTSYRHALVLDYNLPDGAITRGDDGIRRAATPARRHAGGGIFLHATDGTPTSGCIAVRDRIMLDLLGWLDPDQRPVIIIRTRDQA